MKHNFKITAILLGMFLITQAIGLAVIHADPFTLENEAGEEVPNPYLSWVQPPKAEKESDFMTMFLPQIIIAFIIAVGLLFLLSKAINSSTCFSTTGAIKKP